ncbi:hypothetical protein JQ616_33050 [Bradyrhizobium tropiciagri]|uniref:hypothetical protein n=1 Tax=Bradyrhizobium tropiciagri TaxID=312253 RepID=UPI001BAC4B93|nr:hypothetical protein [Bradyrhizobium tropiciagri]MBR0899806.1 hypothetical protein [Bradyrhizobium tropiciagri]
MGDASEVTTVLIPGALQLSNPVPPPITVSLPIVAWPSGGKNVAYGLLALFAGLTFLPVGLFSGFALLFAPWRTVFEPSLWMGIFSVAALALVAGWGVWFGGSCFGAAFTCFRDAIRGDPALEIGADGLRDRRSGLSIPWSSVRSVRFLNSTLSLDLELREAVARWQNPFRVGVVFHRYRQSPNHVVVSVAFLDVSAHVAAYTILALVQSNGGEVITKSQHGPEMYPRLIAQNVLR